MTALQIAGPTNYAEGSIRMGLSTSQQQPTAWRRLTLGFLTMAALLAAPIAAHAQGAVKSTHGDWQIRCDTPPGAQGEQCALIQSCLLYTSPSPRDS